MQPMPFPSEYRLYVYPVFPTFPEPDDPQYCVPPVLGVTVGQGGSPESYAEASASPAVASATDAPPSLLDAELAFDPEALDPPLDPPLPELPVEPL
jgi:hypothetical protein